MVRLDQGEVNGFAYELRYELGGLTKQNKKQTYEFVDTIFGIFEK